MSISPATQQPALASPLKHGQIVRFAVLAAAALIAVIVAIALSSATPTRVAASARPPDAGAAVSNPAALRFFAPSRPAGATVPRGYVRDPATRALLPIGPSLPNRPAPVHTSYGAVP
jgi:hypothetical protein